MRLIDADRIVYSWHIDADGEEHDGVTLQSIIDKIPTVDAVEVVRCKDCKHKYLDDMIWNCPFGLSGGENFFCGYGAKDGDSDDD